MWGANLKEAAVFSLGLSTLYLAVLLLAPGAWYAGANELGPLSLTLVCGYLAFRDIRRSRTALWTPVPWFLLATGVFFGIGPLIYSFGSTESREIVDVFFAADDTALLRTNLLNSIGTTLVAATAWFAAKAFQSFRPSRVAPFNETELRQLIVIFLAIGLSVQYVFVVPYRLGILSWTLPGVVLQLATFSRIAIILLYVLIYRGAQGNNRILLYIVIALEFISAFMSFTKQPVIELFIAIGLGRYLGGQRVRGLVMGGVAIALFYAVFLSPFVTYGRNTYAFQGGIGVRTFSEVINTIEDYYSAADSGSDSAIPAAEGWWTRLSYSGAQAFAMQQYDDGIPGHTISLVYEALLPRFLFPDKAVLTPGREFTALVTGIADVETATTPGSYAEAYWNGGWGLLAIVSIYIGLVYAAFSAFSERVITTRRYEYLPIVLSGVTLGYKINDWFVGNYVGAVGIFAAMYLMLRFVLVPIARGMQSSRAFHAPRHIR
jgi:hypothetical protein